MLVLNAFFVENDCDNDDCDDNDDNDDDDDDDGVTRCM